MHNTKDRRKKKSERMLISVNVLGSSGPIRVVVDGDDDAAAVTKATLNIYARQGRLPILRSDHVTSFSLYPAHAGFDALSPSQKIGQLGTRNFVLCKKESEAYLAEARLQGRNPKRRRWRAWLHKSSTLKFLSC